MLRETFAPGALLHHGQGKWYPGEQLPRWALGCYWRKDGAPVWMDDSLIADESVNYGHTENEAYRFGLALSAALGVDPKWLKAAYEDAFYYLWKEKRLPVNVDPLKSNLKDPFERERLARARARHAENELPQPHVLFVFGFTNLNPEPWRPST